MPTLSNILLLIQTQFKKKLFKETSWSFVTKGSIFVLFMGLNIILARYLGTERFGTLSYFLSVFSIIELISYLGINKVARNYAAKYNHETKLPSVIRTSFTLRLLISLIFSLLLLMFYQPIADKMNRTDLIPLFIASIPLLFFSGILEYVRETFNGLHRIKYNFYIGVTENGAKIIFAVPFVIYFGLIGVIHAFTISFILASGIGLYFLYKRYYKTTEDTHENLTKEMLVQSIPLFLNSIGFMIATEVDTVMVGMLMGDYEVGLYAVAKQVLSKLPHIAFAIAIGVMPLFAKYEKDPENLKKLFYKLLRTNTLIFIPLSLFILCTAWFFVPLIYGTEYSDSVWPLVFLLPYLISVSYSVFFSYFLDYRGKAYKRAINLTVGIALNIFLNFLLIPKFGAAGASIATSASYMPYVILNWVEVRKELQLK